MQRFRNIRLMIVTIALAAVLPLVCAQTPNTERNHAILDHLNAIISWYRHGSTRISIRSLTPRP